MTCAGEGDGTGALGIIQDGAFLVKGGRVAWLGTTKELRTKAVKPRTTIDARGGLVTPGFVDPHTHLMFAGSREHEMEMKARGESYSVILEKGGGIAKTMRETRAAGVQRLVAESAGRAEALLRNGVTTVEVKTGYGQSLRDEVRLATAIALLKARSRAEIVSTFLGLHATPPEFKRSKDYVDYVIAEVLPAISRVAARPTFADCFCEDGFFSAEECRRFLKASAELGFLTKIHADEFSDSGGAAVAAERGCVSADHLGAAGRDAPDLLAKSGVAAVLLPGTALYSGIPFPDARRLYASGCEVALGTDLSPNSWVESPQLVMALACTGAKMTPAQALLAFTRGAASAIQRSDIGALRVGRRADFVVHALPSHEFLPYRIGGRYVRTVYKDGTRVSGA